MMNTINNASVDVAVNEVAARNTTNNPTPEQQSKKTEEVKPSEEQAPAEVSVKQLEMVAQQLQDFVGKMSKSLEFMVDKDSGRDVIKVIDKNNGDIIKQYPSEEVLDLVSKLSEATGSFVNEEV